MNPTDINLEFEVPTQTRYLRLIGSIAELLAKEIDECNCNRDTLAYRLNLVLTEATVNAMQHAHPADMRETVRVNINISGHDVCIRVFDQGQGFDLNHITAPKFDDLSEHGRGVPILRTLMDGSVALAKGASVSVSYAANQHRLDYPHD